MFHGKHSVERLDRAALRVGIDLTPAQRELLLEFADWLATEAAEAGGIGPQERPRLIDRHVADSVVFAVAWDETPADILDVGSGVGLPGIPLAILFPNAAVTLLDRSGKRCRLARRAIKVLGLENVSVGQKDVRLVSGPRDAVVFRASLQTAAALEVALPLLSDRGCAVIGLSRSTEPDQLPGAPPGATVDLLQIDMGVLDSPAWLLRMMPTIPRASDRDPS
jgi:16S rRNA (guanine527-N7)-methyltransferase